MYLLVTREGQVRHPYSFTQLRRDNPHVSFPREPTEEVLAEFGVYPVVKVEQPEPSDPITRQVVAGEPILVKGVWTQTWVETHQRAEDVLQNQKMALDAAQQDSIKGDSFVTQFVAMTPAQVTAHIEATVTNLASAAAVINKLALMMLLMARREFR